MRARAGLSAFALALAASTAFGQIAGSIFTVDGTAAPQDLFSTRTDVSLAAGSVSTPCRVSGSLTDGDYYFQVTDATGSKLLSTDPVSERLVTVTNGVIASYSGSTHALGGPAGCNSITVSLSPYDDAGDRKVAYVVWMTQVASFQGQPTDVGPVCGDGCFFGFRPQESVAHAFRVEDKRNCEPTFCASGTVFSDADGDGLLDNGETGLADMAIHVTGPTGIVLSGISATDGTYQVCGLTSSDTWLVNEAVPNRYQQTGPKDQRISRSLIAKDLGYILLVCCSDFPGLDFGNQLIPGAAGGVVYNDLNASGVRDPGEPPLSGVTVTLTPVSPAGDPQTTVSAADGTYLFRSLNDGRYDVMQTPPAGFTQTQPLSALGYSVTIGPDQPSFSYDFGDFQGALPGSLAGVVFDDLNGNGVRDPGEPGLAGVPVNFALSNTNCNGTVIPALCGQALTDANGGFRFDGLLLQSYVVAETVPSGYQQTAPPPPGTIASTLTLSQPSLTNLLFGNQPLPVRIFGLVFVDANGNGVQDPGEGPEAGVTVQLASPGAATITKTTGADGTFSFDGLGPGTYTISQIVPAGYLQTAPPAPGTFTVSAAPGDVKGPYVFGNEIAPATSSISGDKWIDLNQNGLVDGFDYPLAGIVFILTDSHGVQLTTTSDASGNYSFTNLPPGTYDLKEVLPPNFWQTFPGTKTNPLGYTIVLGVNEHKTGFRFLNKC